MRILAIDPGPTRSAWVVLHGARPITHGLAPNGAVLPVVAAYAGICDVLVVEMIEGRGMPVGASVFETCCWIGRFEGEWLNERGGRRERIYRREIKVRLCGSARAKDSNVRQALLDRYPATGGGKTPQVGTRGKPGPLYGIAKDEWAALAVGLAWLEKDAEVRGQPPGDRQGE